MVKSGGVGGGGGCGFHDYTVISICIPISHSNLLLPFPILNSPFHIPYFPFPIQFLFSILNFSPSRLTTKINDYLDRVWVVYYYSINTTFKQIMMNDEYFDTNDKDE